MSVSVAVEVAEAVSVELAEYDIETVGDIVADAVYVIVREKDGDDDADSVEVTDAVAVALDVSDDPNEGDAETVLVSEAGPDREYVDVAV